MSEDGKDGDRDLSISVDGHVRIVEIHRPPNNFFDHALIRQLADVYESLDADEDCRCIMLCAEGKHFCAGANFQAREDWGKERIDAQAGALYVEAVRLFRTAKPIVAAIHGAAIGGGLGLALSADFRVTCDAARFSANFARLGFHHGFGLTVTLPRLVGAQAASLLLLTGRRVKGTEAVAMGLADELVETSAVRSRAVELAKEIAASGPLAVRAIRATQRGDLAEQIRAATDHELSVQNALRDSADFAEGILASAERRTPRFSGR